MGTQLASTRVERWAMSLLNIIDTDILIDAARNNSDAIYCIDTIEHQSMLAISVITKMELIVGCRNKIELHKMESFAKIQNTQCERNDVQKSS